MLKRAVLKTASECQPSDLNNKSECSRFCLPLMLLAYGFGILFTKYTFYVNT